MRATLNAVYRGSGLLAGFFLVVIGVLSLMQISGRLLGYAVHSFDEFAGYAMAASSFLGLAWTFRCGEQIRMTLALHRTRGGIRRALEIACLGVAALMTGYFTWWTIDMTWTSYTLDDVSQGLVPIKLWIPQSGMALGLAVLVVALLDDLAMLATGRITSYDAAEASKTADAPVFER